MQLHHVHIQKTVIHMLIESNNFEQTKTRWFKTGGTKLTEHRNPMCKKFRTRVRLLYKLDYSTRENLAPRNWHVASQLIVYITV
jgi:hypothetical protein